MQIGWIVVSRRVTRRLAWDPACLPKFDHSPSKQGQYQGVEQQTAFESNSGYYPAFKGLGE